MNFKTTNGRGLPWSLKKEVSILFKFTKEGYIFPMPSDHRELIEILQYMSYFSTKGLLAKEEEEKKEEKEKKRKKEKRKKKKGERKKGGKKKKEK